MASDIVVCPGCGAGNRLRPDPSRIPACGRCRRRLPWLVDADDATFEREVAAALPILVDFWAPWCAPCRMVAPAVEELAREHAGKLKVVKVDVDQSPVTAGRLRVRSIPALVLFRGGEVVETALGAQPKSALAALLRPYL